MNEENVLIEHDQSIDPRIARILTITALVLACCCIMPPGLLWGCANRDTPRGKSMMTGTLCFVLSMLLFMFYAGNLEELDKQEGKLDSDPHFVNSLKRKQQVTDFKKSCFTTSVDSLS